jgi:hypothetical protein
LLRGPELNFNSPFIWLYYIEKKYSQQTTNVMKDLTKVPILCLSFLLFAGILQAQEVKAVLKDGDIEHFIKTFKPMTAELDALGYDFEDEDEDEDEQDPAVAFANMRASMKEILSENEVSTILKKYDWDEDFIDVFIAISIGYSYNKMTTEFEKMDESEKEVTKPLMDLFLDQFRSMVNKKDLDMLQEHMTALDVIFEE